MILVLAAAGLAILLRDFFAYVGALTGMSCSEIWIKSTLKKFIYFKQELISTIASTIKKYKIGLLNRVDIKQEFPLKVLT